MDTDARDKRPLHPDEAKPQMHVDETVVGRIGGVGVVPINHLYFLE